MRMRNPKFKDEVLKNCNFYYEESGFDNNNPIHLEIGMGKGNFIIGMAKEYPNINFIGVEKFPGVACIAIKKIEEEKLNNIKVIVDDVVNTSELLKDKIDVIYLNFSDPWPKKRYFKRRLTHENQLKVYDILFKDEKIIYMKTDNDDLFEYSLESLKDYGYTLNKVSYDMHKEIDKFNAMTEYEEKFSNMGVKIKYLDASKK